MASVTGIPGAVWRFMMAMRSWVCAGCGAKPRAVPRPSDFVQSILASGTASAVVPVPVSPDRSAEVFRRSGSFVSGRGAACDLLVHRDPVEKVGQDVRGALEAVALRGRPSPTWLPFAFAGSLGSLAFARSLAKARTSSASVSIPRGILRREPFRAPNPSDHGECAVWARHACARTARFHPRPRCRCCPLPDRALRSTAPRGNQQMQRALGPGEKS
ncbi:hypothetical protein JSE7799_03142 [Jannaschia seosinensis]|uniref:Uncharacterized protein n=1 Tax=Jannaschia seosinensis TaxID=313367 RepID=A0A0M7BCE7_9RHOB|nr:hypothetical protein JSE7799_03142 [Jannaschia seosinensis]